MSTQSRVVPTVIELVARVHVAEVHASSRMRDARAVSAETLAAPAIPATDQR
jgi:hypothetical protein